jgi:hypothetical protein
MKASYSIRAIILTGTMLWGLVTAQGGEVRETVTFHKSDLFFSRFAGYDVIELMPYGMNSEVGKPQLPALDTYIAIPPGTRLERLGAASVTIEKIPGTYKILPVQQPIPTSAATPSTPWVDPDPAVYTSSRPYPEQIVELRGEADLAGQGLVAIRIHPIRYVGASGKLSFVQSLEVVIQYQETDEEVVVPRLSAQARTSYQRSIQRLVLNPEDVTLLVPDSDAVHWSIPPDRVDYVIITETALEPYFKDLADWHTKCGIPARIVLKTDLDDWYGGNAGSYPDSIRNFVMDAHIQWGAVYFLCGGGMGKVPVKYKNFGAPGVRYGDTYYADYDDDWICEVHVGRIPADLPSHVETYVEKALFYMKNPPSTDYPEKILLTGFDMDENTHCEELMRFIVNNYIPEECVVCSVYDSHAGDHKAETTTYLNQGQHVWVHADHGNTNLLGVGSLDGWLFYNSDVDLLYNDNELTHIYTPACLPGNFAGDSWCEHWCQLNPLEAGISFIGNTSYGYYRSGNCFGLSNTYQWNWAYCLWDQDNHRLGELFSDHKNRTPPGSDQYMQAIYYNLELIGDPAIDMWPCHDLSGMDVHYPAFIPQGTQSFTITVEDGGSPVEGGLVCVMKGDEVYAHGLTGTDGTVTFTISPTTEGTMDVTATHSEYLPYEGLCTVVDMTITLTPDTTIIHRGGTLGYKVTVTNNGESSVYLEYWTDIILWNGKPYGKNPPFGPKILTVASGKTRQGHISHRVPGNAPLRTYTCCGRIGSHPETMWDEDSFEFTVIDMHH